MTSIRRRPVLSAILLGCALLEVFIAVAAGLASGRGWDFLLGHFVVTNALIGGSLAVAGWPIGWQRPRNPIGWLLLAGGICYAGSAAAFSLLAWGSEPGDQRPFWRFVGTVANASWTFAISVFIPLTILLFPTGKFVGRFFRWILVPATISGLLSAATGVFATNGLAAELDVPAYLVWPGFERFAWVGVVAEVAGDIVFGGAAVSLVVRYWRGDERVRRQMLWLLLAFGIVLVGFTVPDLLGVVTYASLFAIALIPLSIMIAVLRYQLLDIRLVVSRFALYVLLSGLVILGYLGLVALFERAAGWPQTGRGVVFVVLVLAVVFHPVRVWLQRRVDRLFYGSRQDPIRALAEVGDQLSDSTDPGGLNSALTTLCTTLRIPAAAIRVDGAMVAEVGVLSSAPYVTPLRHGAELVGELLISQRTGERRLAVADRRILDLLANLLAVTVQATGLAEELRDSRAQLVSARDEERRRLRRDLHDGLGPRLTGVIMKAGAARRFTGTEPERAAELLAELEVNTASAIDDIRRLVDELRPPTLDGLGLVGALQQYADSINPVNGSGLQVEVHAEQLAPLPAAVEVAAYRIATESLTNVIRHAGATLAALVIRVQDGELLMEIADNGRTTAPWSAGVGLTSMGERAAMLGGRFTAGPQQSGGRVSVALPLQPAGLSEQIR